MQLRDFQQQGLDVLSRFNRCAFYWDMGLGKTFVGAEKLVSFGGKVSLVVCQKSKIDDWLQHFKSYYRLPVYDLTKPIIMGNFLKTDLRRIGIINYDLIFRRKQLLNLKNLSVLLDESSMIKNDTAIRTKFCMQLDIENLVLLSGTPVGGKYEELYSQCKLLGWNISKRAFWERYINWNVIQLAGMDFPIKKVTGYKNVEELKEKLREHGANFLKSDAVLNLPEQNFIDINVECPKEYKKFLKDKYIKIKSGIKEFELVADAPIKKLLYARQIAGVFNKNKLLALKDLLESTEDRIIIFYNFWEEYEAIKEICKDRPISVVNGKEKDLKAYETKDNSITLIQPQAGAMGLNLQKANKIVYFSPMLSSELFEQSKKRTHRIGQKSTCFYYYLKTNNSIEIDIYNTLAKRQDYTVRLFE